MALNSVKDSEEVRVLNDSSDEKVNRGRGIFSSAKWALALFSIASLLQQLVVNGLYSVVVSTLERRFELRSTETGFMAGVFGIAASVTTFFILFVKENVHKARLFSFGTCIIGLGVLLFAMPHFIAPTYTVDHTNDFNYCGNVTEPECNGTSSSIRQYRHVFSLSIALMGAGSSFQHAYGISYLDENVSKDNSALYNSIFFAVTGLGAAVGFVAGGCSLNYFTYLDTNATELPIGSDSELWVGAWWLCYVITAVATFLVAIPISLFPRHLPGTEIFRENRNAEMQKIASDNHEKDIRSFSRKKSDFTYLLRNKPYVLITLGSAVNCALIFGFNTFGAKYMETVFGTTPFQASLIYGACVVIASLAGQLTGGYLIKRFSMSVKGIIKFIIAGGAFSALCSFGFFIHCPDPYIAGATVPYINTTDTSLLSQCNVNCGCSPDKYQPVCSNDVIYFSPCYAGCTKQYNDTVYGSCSCVTGDGLATSIGCNRNACSNLYPFVISIFFCFFSSILTISPSLQITLRCVPFDKRILAISLQVICAVIYSLVYVTYEPTRRNNAALEHVDADEDPPDSVQGNEQEADRSLLNSSNEHTE